MPDPDPCETLVAEGLDLAAEEVAAEIILEAAQAVLNAIRMARAVNAMNQVENGCVPPMGMVAQAPVDEAARKAAVGRAIRGIQNDLIPKLAKR